MEHTTVYIALGTNLEDRCKNLREAISQLPPKVLPVAYSPIYQTAPWGYLNQPFFLNQVIEATTDLLPEELLDYLKQIEKIMGRQETVKLGPRLIDLDILFYDNLVLNAPNLTIPHPYLHQRSFVLAPLADLAPEKIHPILMMTVREMLAVVDKADVQKLKSGDCG